MRDGFLNSLQIFGAGMEEQVDVHVNQAGHQRGVAEINYLRSRWMRDGCADFGDAFALDEDFTGRDDATGFDIEKARGVKDCGVSGGGARLSRRVGVDGNSEQ
jgi:hypothetical protein